ncbi:site-specific DNA-methyltransferase [Vibrio sp. 10N.247.311.26]|uniref:DNA-methyltransferase n=1 Tax=Vibrio sp. 10N.247.311.26 TaxID=3229995 RepID=UPI00355441AD
MTQIKIHNQDCLNLFKTIKDESVDLLVTDPPYKISSGGCKVKKSANEPTGIFNKRSISDNDLKRKWLNKSSSNTGLIKTGSFFKHNKIEFKDWLSEAFRVMKNKTHVYIMVNDRNLNNLINEAQRVGFKLQNVLVWKKQNATPNKYYMKNCEFVVMFRKGNAKNINNMGTKTVIEIKNIIGNKSHPTEKPVELNKLLIENSSNEGDLVLDPFLGSGSSSIAALETDRNFIGSEIDPEYFDIAETRINENKSLKLAA